MNEYNVYKVNAVTEAMRSFADTLASALDIIAPIGTLAPYWDEFRIVSEWSMQTDIEADLIIASGVQVTIRTPLTAQGTTAEELAARLSETLGKAMKDPCQVLRLLRRIERKAHRMMKEELLAGLDARIEAVRLATVRLDHGKKQLGVEITIEGGACHMLRPYRDTFIVADEHDLDKMFETLRHQLTPRRERLQTARAIGAVGFVDSVALAVMDTLPGGREELLPRIARRLEIRKYVATTVEDSETTARPTQVGFAWYDGIVRVYATLAKDADRCWDNVILGGGNLPEGELIGRAVTDFAPHPFLEGLHILAVMDPCIGQVRVTDRLFAFSETGEVFDPVEAEERHRRAAAAA